MESDTSGAKTISLSKGASNSWQLNLDKASPDEDGVFQLDIDHWHPLYYDSKKMIGSCDFTLDRQTPMVETNIEEDQFFRLKPGGHRVFCGRSNKSRDFLLHQSKERYRAMLFARQFYRSRRPKRRFPLQKVGIGWFTTTLPTRLATKVR